MFSSSPSLSVNAVTNLRASERIFSALVCSVTEVDAGRIGSILDKINPSLDALL
jgi:hypothetical protein